MKNGSTPVKKRMRCLMIERGDILLVDLEPVKGSEQGKIRPCLVVQNNIGNNNSSTTIIAAISSKVEKEFPFTVFVEKGVGNLSNDSLILCNEIRSISIKHRLIKKLGSLSESKMIKVNSALKVSLGLD